MKLYPLEGRLYIFTFINWEEDVWKLHVWYHMGRPGTDDVTADDNPLPIWMQPLAGRDD